MATRKGDDEPRGAERKARGDEERPGVYVQVVGTPRRRKSSATNAKVSVQGAAPHSVERVGVPAGRYHVERSEDMVDDTRPIERTFAAPHRGHGPLGMEDDPRQPPEPRKSSEARRAPEPSAGLKRTSLGLGPRLDPELLVETYTREQATRAEPVRERVHTPVQRFEASFPPSPAKELSSPPLEYEPKPAQHVRVVEVGPSEPPPSEHTSHRADIVRAPASSVVVHEQQPEQLPSLLDARPSIRPSDPVRSRREGPSWSMVVAVAVLSSIIASAGVVALQELFRGGARDAGSLATDGNRGAARPAAPGAPNEPPAHDAPAVLPVTAQAAPEVAPLAATAEAPAAAPVAATAEEPAAAPVAATAEAPAPAPAALPTVDPAPEEPSLQAPSSPDTAASLGSAAALPGAQPAKGARPLAQGRAGMPGRAVARPQQKAAPESPAKASPAKATRAGAGNRILSDGLVAPDHGAVPSDDSSALPSNPYE
jgi:hypothetical protein